MELETGLDPDLGPDLDPNLVVKDYVNGLTAMEILEESGVIQKRIVRYVVVHGAHHLTHHLNS